MIAVLAVMLTRFVMIMVCLFAGIQGAGVAGRHSQEDQAAGGEDSAAAARAGEAADGHEAGAGGVAAASRGGAERGVPSTEGGAGEAQGEAEGDGDEEREQPCISSTAATGTYLSGCS